MNRTGRTVDACENRDREWRETPKLSHATLGKQHCAFAGSNLGGPRAATHDRRAKAPSMEEAFAFTCGPNVCLERQAPVPRGMSARRRGWAGRTGRLRLRARCPACEHRLYATEGTAEDEHQRGAGAAGGGKAGTVGELAASGRTARLRLATEGGANSVRCGDAQAVACHLDVPLDV